MEYLGIPFSVKNTPCLQPDFLPFAPWRTAYLSQARQPFRIAVEGNGTVVYETRIRGGSPCRPAISGAHHQAAAVERRRMAGDTAGGTRS